MGDQPAKFYGLYGPPTSQPQAQVPSVYPHYPEPSPPPEPDKPIIPGVLICEQCKEPIHHGDVAVEILLGFLMRGKKSGRWMVEQLNDESTPAIVHDHCCVRFCVEQITGDDGEAYNFDPYSSEKYCAGCGVKLDD